MRGSNRRPVAWLLLAAAAFLIGCGGQPAATPSPDASGPRAEISWSPQQPIALRPLSYELRISDAAGQPLDLEIATAKAAMPEMEHGTEPLRPTRVGPGRFTGTHTFSMDGSWTLTFEGTAGGRPVTARVTVDVGR